MKSFQCFKCKGNERLFFISSTLLGRMKGENTLACWNCWKIIIPNQDQKELRQFEEFLFSQTKNCSLHQQPKDLGIKDSNCHWKRYCFSCEKNNLQRLTINPLSLVKLLILLYIFISVEISKRQTRSNN